MRDLNNLIERILEEAKSCPGRTGETLELELHYIKTMTVPPELEYKKWEHLDIVIRKYAPIVEKWKRNVAAIYLGERGEA